jgi:hypothetical protein
MPAKVDSTIKDNFLLTVRIASRGMLLDIVQRFPRFARFVNQHNRIVDDRNEATSASFKK